MTNLGHKCPYATQGEVETKDLALPGHLLGSGPRFGIDESQRLFGMIEAAMRDAMPSA